MLYAILAAIILIADQWVKYWTTVNIVLDTGESALIPGFVKLVNVHNTGAAFGFLSSAESARMIFLIVAAVFVLALIIIIARHVFPGKFASICCTMAIAGALGNCIDRFIYGYVVDMFKLEFINFAVFNVADIFLVLACILFILYLLFGYKGNEEESEAPAVEEAVEEKPKKEKKQKKVKNADAEKESVSDEDVVVSAIESTELPEETAVPVSGKAEKAEKAEKPAPKPAKKPEATDELDLNSDEFSVEAILNEFKYDF